MPRSTAAPETIDAPGASVVLRRTEGPIARELFAVARAHADSSEPGEPARAVYRALADVLAAEGGDLSAVVSEMRFLRDAGADSGHVRRAADAVRAETGAAGPPAAVSELGQPSLAHDTALEVAVHAILPASATAPGDSREIRVDPVCPCAGCASASARFLRVAGEERLHAGTLYGAGADAHAQTWAMFELAERILERAGMSFSDVVRTWIHLRQMERDYDAFNRARREFFSSRHVDPIPASTGIGAGLAPVGHDLGLGFLALRPAGAAPLVRTPMTAPTLNEAPRYGSDFARGMRVVEGNKVALHVSGTASIDEAGRTAHEGDLDAQVDRMLVNVEALLGGQGATFGDVVSAITYVKHPADADRLRERLRAAGYDGFPHALVAAPVCRPELLCETEALAVLPVPSD